MVRGVANQKVAVPIVDLVEVDVMNAFPTSYAAAKSGLSDHEVDVASPPSDGVIDGHIPAFLKGLGTPPGRRIDSALGDNHRKVFGVAGLGTEPLADVCPTGHINLAAEFALPLGASRHRIVRRLRKVASSANLRGFPTGLLPAGWTNHYRVVPICEASDAQAAGSKARGRVANNALHASSIPPFREDLP